MPLPASAVAFALDLSTLITVSTWVTALLGLFLLFAWVNDRVLALAWLGVAYLIGGFSVAVWSFESYISPPLPRGFDNALVFVACGMIWSAGRLFHGRAVLWGAMTTGAFVWLTACLFDDFKASLSARVTLASLIIAAYTFMTAAELWRERRRHLISRWPAIFVPLLHGTIFLFPIPLASVLPAERGAVTLTPGWFSVFALEIMLYVVGTAFIVLIMSKERAVRVYKTAAFTDPMTGLLNRRGFVDAAHELIVRQTKRGFPVSVLMFDLDRFKSINDTYGHAVGDDALKVFGQTAARTLRATDILSRFGGEEFVAIIPGSIEDALVAADRVRAAFQVAGVQVGEHTLNATVSIGAASAAVCRNVDQLIADADAALYCAKVNGRNRVERYCLPNANVDLEPELLPMAA